MGLQDVWVVLGDRKGVPHFFEAEDLTNSPTISPYSEVGLGTSRGHLSCEGFTLNRRDGAKTKTLPYGTLVKLDSGEVISVIPRSVSGERKKLLERLARKFKTDITLEKTG